MRKSNDEFKNEVFARAKAYKQTQRIRTRAFVSAIASVMCVTAVIIVILPSFSVKDEPENISNPGVSSVESVQSRDEIKANTSVDESVTVDLPQAESKAEISVDDSVAEGLSQDESKPDDFTDPESKSDGDAESTDSIAAEDEDLFPEKTVIVNNAGGDEAPEASLNNTLKNALVNFVLLLDAEKSAPTDALCETVLSFTIIGEDNVLHRYEIRDNGEAFIDGVCYLMSEETVNEAKKLASLIG